MTKILLKIPCETLRETYNKVNGMLFKVPFQGQSK